MDYKNLIESAPVVLVEFYASWCPHCQRMMPVVAQVKERIAGRAEIKQIDIDENNDIADELGVKTVPTFIVYKNGREQWRQSGEIDGDMLVRKVEACL